MLLTPQIQNTHELWIWKMMEHAKILQKIKQTTSTLGDKCLPCTPNDPKWVINKTQNDPRQNEEYKCATGNHLCPTVLGHLPYFQKNITGIVKS